MHERFKRQIKILGEEGQRKLSESRVLIGGLGGLGSVVSLYLSAAGVGSLVLVDDDVVSMSDLNRQLLYTPNDLGKRKVEVAERRIKEFNPEVEIKAVGKHLDVELALDLARDVDVIVDCFDNWESRFCLDDASQKLGIPLVHGAVEEMYGVVLSVKPGETPGLRRIYGKPRSKSNIQVVGATAGLVGAYQALEVIKILTGTGNPLYGKMMYIDGKNNVVSIIDVL